MIGGMDDNPPEEEAIPIGSSAMLQQPPPDQRAAVSLEIVEHHMREQAANPGAAGMDRTLCCTNCKQLFRAPNKLSGQQRTSFEYETLRRVLMIQDPNILPVFCDPCFEQAVIPPESRAMSFPNLVLEKLNVQSSGD